ncbi:MAG: hypothetical protein MMC33_003717 [Icmadophila ericetorum]|nr:hypothetical protein [Icmadophila ericetorum]
MGDWEPATNEGSDWYTNSGTGAGTFGMAVADESHGGEASTSFEAGGYGDAGGGGEGRQMGNCFNCDQPGHNKADCPNPRVERPFTGTCRICSEEGHRSSECPSKPPAICKNCGGEGHRALECKEKRAKDFSNVEEATPEDAWAMIKVADETDNDFGGVDLDAMKKAIQVYVKAQPDATFAQIELGFRAQEFRTYLIAVQKEKVDNITIVDLQGEIDKTYQISFQLSEKPRRRNDRQGWPKTPEENLERLKDAGFPEERHVPRCANCGQLGHTKKACPEELIEKEKVEDTCMNCKGKGHQMRNCPEARIDHNLCRNCKQPGHKSNECTEPRSAEGVECKKCKEMGHFAKDCPKDTRQCRNCGGEGHVSKDCDQPRNMDNVICRNCEKSGHLSKECTEPKDWSKVQCQNCKKMGHTVKRCKEVTADPNEGGAGDYAGGFEMTSASVATEGDWMNTTADAGAPTGDWDPSGPAEASW